MREAGTASTCSSPRLLDYTMYIHPWSIAMVLKMGDLAQTTGVDTHITSRACYGVVSAAVIWSGSQTADTDSPNTFISTRCTFFPCLINSIDQPKFCHPNILRNHKVDVANVAVHVSLDMWCLQPSPGHDATSKEEEIWKSA